MIPVAGKQREQASALVGLQGIQNLGTFEGPLHHRGIDTALRVRHQVVRTQQDIHLPADRVLAIAAVRIEDPELGRKT